MQVVVVRGVVQVLLMGSLALYNRVSFVNQEGTVRLILFLVEMSL
jgi:hypothetical protein